MASRRVDKNATRRRPATTPEEREKQLVAAAYDRAEQQIQDGTASAQVITHFLKLGSTREAVEQERLRGEVRLQEAKREQLQSQKRMEELTAEALQAMRSYVGLEPADEDEELQ